MAHHRRVSSRQELLTNLKRARKFAERYGVDEAHPDDYQDPAPDDFARLLDRMK